MSFLSWMRYIPTSAGDFTRTAGAFKDAVADPADTSGSLVRNIVRRQPFIIQRIIAIGLLLGAMLLGADIGIEYQKSLTPTPIVQSVPVNPQPMVLEAPTVEEEPPPNFTEPVARPAPQKQIERREQPRVKPKVQIKRKEEKRGQIFSGPFHFGSSGPGGY